MKSWQGTSGALETSNMSPRISLAPGRSGSHSAVRKVRGYPVLQQEQNLSWGFLPQMVVKVKVSVTSNSLRLYGLSVHGIHRPEYQNG